MKTVFSLRLVTVDYYLEKPIKGVDVVYSDFRESSVWRLPIVRVFGTTPVGQKACVHLHGMFPYLLVQHESRAGQLTADYLQQLAVSIDQALQLSLGQSSRTQEHVFKISAVEGIPFYGYHSTPRKFLKIYLYNPGLVQRLAELLRGGAVMNRQMVPHETHIPFTLQVFIDYNLYGMSFLDLAAVKFRQPLILGGETFSGTRNSSEDSVLLSGHGDPAQTHWTVDNIPSDLQLGAFVPRGTRCELEVDAVADDILNRYEKPSSGVANPGIAAIWSEECQRRLALGLSPLKRMPSQERHHLEDEEIEKRLKAELHDMIGQRWKAHEQRLLSSQSNTSPEEINMSQRRLESSECAASESVGALVDESIVEEVTASQSWLAGSGALALQLITDLASLSQSEEVTSKQAVNAPEEHELLPSSCENDELTAAVRLSDATKTTEQAAVDSYQVFVNSTLEGSAGLSKADSQQLGDSSWPSVLGSCETAARQPSLSHASEQPSSSLVVDSTAQSFSSFPSPAVPVLSQSSSSLPATGPPANLLQEQMLQRSMLLVDSDDDEPLQEMQKLEKEESVLMSQAFWGEDEPPRQEEAGPSPIKRRVSFDEMPQCKRPTGGEKPLPSRKETAGLPVQVDSWPVSSHAVHGRSQASSRIKGRRLSGRSRSASYQILTRQRKKEERGVFGRKMLLKVKRLSSQEVDVIMGTQKVDGPALEPTEERCENQATQEYSEETLFDSQLDSVPTFGKGLLERMQSNAHFYASDKSSFFSHSTFQFEKQDSAMHRARDDSTLDMLSGYAFHTSPLPAADDALFALGFVSPPSTPPQHSSEQCDRLVGQLQLPNKFEDRGMHGCKKGREEGPKAIAVVNEGTVLSVYDKSSEEAPEDQTADGEVHSNNSHSLQMRKSPAEDTTSAHEADVEDESVSEKTESTLCDGQGSTDKTRMTSLQVESICAKLVENSCVDDKGSTVAIQHFSDRQCKVPEVKRVLTRESSSFYQDSNRENCLSKQVTSQTPSARMTLWTPLHPPPPADSLLASALSYGVPIAVHTTAFYSKPDDVTSGRHVGHNQLFVPSSAVVDELEFRTGDAQKVGGALHQWRLRLNAWSDFSLRLAQELSLEHISSTGSNRNAAVLQWAEQRAALAPVRKCLITPNRSPPSVENALCWLKDKKVKSHKGAQTGKVDAVSGKQQKGQSWSCAEQAVEVGEGSLEGDMNSSENDAAHKILPKLDLGQSVADTGDGLSSPLTPTSLSMFTPPSPLKPTAHSTPAPVVVSPNLDKRSPGAISTPTASRRIPKYQRVCSSSPKSALFKWSPEGSLVTPMGKRRHSVGFSQLDGPTPKNTYGFRVTQLPSAGARSVHECQHLTILSVELHMRTRGSLLPDPDLDPVCGLFYCVHRDTPDCVEPDIVQGVLLHDDMMSKSEDARMHFGTVINHLEVFNNEIALFESLVTLVQRLDPDILVGYEVQKASWGYLLQRAQTLKFDLLGQLSRVVGAPHQVVADEDHPADEYNARHTSELRIPGRVILNVWRIMRHEVTLNIYSFENVVFHALRLRLPRYSHHTLSHWFGHQPALNRHRVVEYYQARAYYTLQLLTKLHLISRTSELARVFGIQFYDVLSRGSQFRVESMMLRLAKPANYVAVSPSVQQRAQMNAPECIPLVMEPESRFYTDPVIVVDFQSLYPSIIIAHNYCFSTCLGRVSQLCQDGEFKFGCTSLSVCADELKALESSVSISPNGIVFVKEHVRRGILPIMLEEILSTRIMVKQVMKDCRENKMLHRLLDHRQLGLKLIANVTYGYTSANFSGRMPCVEVADSVVRKARETLERAIDLVSTTKRWGARVVYGDTDSMFILLEGASKERAFNIGQEIVNAVTAANPKPIKLKFEKVYYPCVLQTKKRYVGYKYETPDQVEPVFEAKGIETVRRDSCPAVSKTLERTLKLLFDSRDMSQCKAFVQRQCSKVLEGRASLQDLIFAKEYRGRSSYQPGACVPCLEITKRLLAVDRRAEPLVGERVPYVVVCGLPGQPLIQLVRRPEDVLDDRSLRLNAVYYITKQILPPLHRVLSLLGVDVFSWYEGLPRTVRTRAFYQRDMVTGKASIAQYFTSLHCPVCHELTHRGICNGCQDNRQRTVAVLSERLRLLEAKYHMLCELCSSCSGNRSLDVSCVSHDCPIFFRRVQAEEELRASSILRDTYLVQ